MASPVLRHERLGTWCPDRRRPVHHKRAEGYIGDDEQLLNSWPVSRVLGIVIAVPVAEDYLGVEVDRSMRPVRFERRCGIVGWCLLL